MSTTLQQPVQKLATARQQLSAGKLFAVAAWFGLVAGLIEGCGLLAVYGYGLWNRFIRPGVSVEIVWISALFDFVLFLCIAAMMLVARRMFRLPAAALVTGFALITFGDWVSLTGRISSLGAASLTLGLTAVFYRWFVRHERPVIAFFKTSLPAFMAFTVLVAASIQGGLRLQRERAIAALPPAAKNAPNVVFLVIDTLRADHLSSYGYNRPTSPHIDQLAQQSVVFDNAISSAPWTLPAHASLLTGRLPHEHLAVGDEPLHTHFPNLAEAMRSRGYTTAAFSGNDYYFTRRAGFGRGFVYFDDYYYSLADTISRTFWGRVFVHFSDHLGLKEFPVRQRAEQIKNQVFSWIDRYPDKPFFVFINFNDLHDPYLPPQPWRGKFSAEREPGGVIRQGNAYPQLTPAQLQGEMDSYDGALAYTDDQVGSLLAGLRKRGRAQNTLFILVADHGECFGDHSLLEHRNALYRELVHVPLMISWPGKVPAGLRLDGAVSTDSLPATVLDLLGASSSNPQNNFPGPSLAGLWNPAGNQRSCPIPSPRWPSTNFFRKAIPPTRAHCSRLPRVSGS